MSTNEHTSPEEHAALVRDARALIAAMERGVRRTGAVFVIAMFVTVAATALGLDYIASGASVVGVVAFATALIILMARIALGDAPAPLDEATTDVARSAPQGSDAAPETGSSR